MSEYRQLDSELIVFTLEKLSRRIDERFPESGLAAVARELLAIGRECEGRLRLLRAPNWPIRIIAGIASLAFLGVVVTALASLRVTTQINGVVDLVQGIESGINDVIFFGLGLFFLLTLESRLKRRDALKSLHELRSIAHIVDMHQLTKDPEQILTPEMAKTLSSPPRAMSRFALARYLDYCTELLALTGKLASLHAQDLRDPVVLEAVNDLEALTVGLSRKIWQKITILDTIGPRVGSGGD